MTDQQRLAKLEREIMIGDAEIRLAERAIERSRLAGINTKDEQAKLQVVLRTQAERIALRIALLTGQANDNSN